MPPRAGHLPAFGEPPWRGSGDARSDPRCTLVGLAQSSQATPSKGVCRVRPPSSRDTVRRGSVSWDRPRGGQLEPRLPSLRHSREGLHSETGVLPGHTPPGSVSRSSPLPRAPCSGGGAPGADVSAPSLARAVSCPLPRAGSSLPGDRCCLMPSAAAGNSRLRGLALHLTRMGTPHYVTLGEALTTTASRGPAPLPSQPLWAQPRGLQPTHVSGFFALSSRPHDRLRSCPEPGAVCSKQRGAASSEGAVWGARRGGCEEAPRAGPCGVTWVQRPGWTDQPRPSAGP